MHSKNSRIIIILVFIVLFSSINIFGQSAAVAESAGEDTIDAFTLSPAVDIPLSFAGIALLVTDVILEPVSGLQQPREDIFFLDKGAIFSYNSMMDRTCDVLFVGSLLLPLASVIGQDLVTILEVGAMFLETMVLTYATKDIIKDLVPRYRPYTYLSEPLDDDALNSFPSGHTAAVFAVCSFSSYVFAEMFPTSEWKVPIGIGASVIAATTGVLRIVSGNHFITDVFAGALIGTVYGIGVPLLHKIKLKDGPELAVKASIIDEPALTLSFRL